MQRAKVNIKQKSDSSCPVSGSALPECKKTNSKQIAAILGSSVDAMTAAEFSLVRPQLYDAQIPPVFYLSGRADVRRWNGNRPRSQQLGKRLDSVGKPLWLVLFASGLDSNVCCQPVPPSHHEHTFLDFYADGRLHTGCGPFHHV